MYSYGVESQHTRKVQESLLNSWLPWTWVLSICSLPCRLALLPTLGSFLPTTFLGFSSSTFCSYCSSVWDCLVSFIYIMGMIFFWLLKHHPSRTSTSKGNKLARGLPNHPSSRSFIYNGTWFSKMRLKRWWEIARWAKRREISTIQPLNVTARCQPELCHCGLSSPSVLHLVRCQPITMAFISHGGRIIVAHSKGRMCRAIGSACIIDNSSRLHFLSSQYCMMRRVVVGAQLLAE